MSIKEITYTVPGIVEVDACKCKDAIICLGSEAAVSLAEDLLGVFASIKSSTIKYKTLGTVQVTECGKTVSQKVIYPESELVLRYESAQLSNEEDEIAESDISCVTTDSCLVRVLQKLIDVVEAEEI